MSDDVVEAGRRLQRLFREAARLGEIAEPLVSFDAATPAAAARAALERRGFRVAGVREGGLVHGYVRAADLRGAGACGEAQREFEPLAVLPQETPLAEALERLGQHDQLFVTAFGAVAGIVTWSDIQKPAARMWLFGLVTVLELALAGLVEAFHPDDSWTELVSEGRLAKARELLLERRRNGAGPELRLADCLQLADKGLILLRRDDTRRVMGAESKSAGERRLRRLVRLRDNLAHAQDVVSGDWEVLVEFARALDRILALGSAFARPRRARRR